MSTQTRDLTSTASDQPSRPKKPCLAPSSQVWNESERNLVAGSCLMEEDVQRVCGEETECAKSHSAEYCQSCTGNALKDIVQWMHSMENSFQKLVRKELELVQSHIVKQFREELKFVKSHFVRQVREVVPEISSLLEDTSRRVVREELEHASSQSAQLARSSGKFREKDEVRNLQLQFKTKLSLPLFTGQKLEGEHGAPIVVVLINAKTGDMVESGPESSVKLDVVVLDGDFKKEGDDYWTPEEFEKNVVKEREGKRPLLTGNLEVILKGGTGVLGELEFTDNSCWMRSKKFRLGLRVSPGYCENICVCEAKTEAFIVREHRGESYKKHYPPTSDDEVWRLETISKDGPFRKRLNEAGIYKVDEFLRLHSTDCKELRNILGKGMTDKKWKVLLDHAKTCTLDAKFYVYYHANGSDHGVIINNVGQLCGLTANGVFGAIDRFSLQQKDYADRLVKKACENWNDVRQFDPKTSSHSMPEKISCSFLSGVPGDQQCCRPVRDNMPPPESQVGLNVPPKNLASTGEGKSGITAAQLPIQSQSLNSQRATCNPIIESFNQMEPSADTNLQPSGSFPGNSGMPAAPLKIQSQSLNSQNASGNQYFDNWNEMEPSRDTNVQPFRSFPGNSDIHVAPLEIQSQSLNSQNASRNQYFHSLNQMEPSRDTNVQPFGSFPGNSGIPVAPLEIQSQSLNSQNASGNQYFDSWNEMEPSRDTNVQPFGSFPGNSGIPAAQLPIQRDPTIESMNQMEPSADTNVQPFGQPYGPPSTFLASRNSGIPLSPGNSGIPVAQLPIQRDPIIESTNQTEPSADANVQPFGQPYGPPSTFLASRNSGIPAAPLARQSQSVNFQNATWNQIYDSLDQMEPSRDANVQPSRSFPGNSGITAAQLPMQSQSLNSQPAVWNPIIDSLNQTEPSEITNVQPSGSFPGNSGIPAAPLAIQSRSLNSQNASGNQYLDSWNQMEPSRDTNVQPFGSFPGNSGIPLSPGNSGIPAAQLPTQWDPIIESMNQTEPSADTNVQPFEQPYGSPSSFLASTDINVQPFGQLHSPAFEIDVDWLNGDMDD